MSIVDAQGTVVASYEYDPYGNIVTASGTLAEVNPIRYRGYYFDSETGLYYLQSRYYDPDIGRFINADTYISNGQGFVGMNMFAYCLNNPVNGYDPCGTCFHRWDFWNDCEECGGKTLGDKVSNAVTTIKKHHRLERETQNEVSRLQRKLIHDTAQKGIERYANRIRVQAEAQYQQDMGIIRLGHYFAENPMSALDLVADATAVTTWYAGLCILLVPLNVPVVGQVVISMFGGAATFWSIGRNSVSAWETIGKVYYGEEP